MHDGLCLCSHVMHDGAGFLGHVMHDGADASWQLLCSCSCGGHSSSAAVMCGRIRSWCCLRLLRCSSGSRRSCSFRFPGSRSRSIVGFLLRPQRPQPSRQLAGLCLDLSCSRSNACFQLHSRLAGSGGCSGRCVRSCSFQLSYRAAHRLVLLLVRPKLRCCGSCSFSGRERLRNTSNTSGGTRVVGGLVHSIDWHQRRVCNGRPLAGCSAAQRWRRGCYCSRSRSTRRGPAGRASSTK